MILILKYDKLKIYTNSDKIIKAKKINKRNNKMPPWYNEYRKIGMKKITAINLLTNSKLNNCLKFSKNLLSAIVSISFQKII